MYVRDPAHLNTALGIDSPGLRLFVPLDPKTGLLLCDPVEVRENKDEVIWVKNQVERLNLQQVLWSERYVLSQKREFTAAEDLLKSRQELCGLIAGLFGGFERLREAVDQLQSLLYAA